jgi:hypothetical protein
LDNKHNILLINHYFFIPGLFIVGLTGFMEPPWLDEPCLFNCGFVLPEPKVVPGGLFPIFSPVVFDELYDPDC